MYTDAYVSAVPFEAVERAALWRARAGCGCPTGASDACVAHAVEAGFCPCIRCADGGVAGESPLAGPLREEIARRSRELLGTA